MSRKTCLQRSCTFLMAPGPVAVSPVTFMILVVCVFSLFIFARFTGQSYQKFINFIKIFKESAFCFTDLLNVSVLHFIDFHVCHFLLSACFGFILLGIQIQNSMSLMVIGLFQWSISSWLSCCSFVLLRPLLSSNVSI